METLMSKPVKDRKKIIYALFGREPVGLRIIKAIKDIEKEGKKARLIEIRKKGIPSVSLHCRLPYLLDSGIVVVGYSDPNKMGRMDTYYKVNRDYEWVAKLTE
ncbi:hypothetical protein A3K64_00600 [Candidatus Micrarchaeota archaeon RBG_16_36_9]|nr:MAG: hypothetical protein A3K64_00600 [Candidatus Micrarchaeota archaeon RBG_16_36_9]